MRSTILAAAVAAILIFLLVLIYNALPDLQGWIIFSAMTGMGMSLARHAKHAAGGGRPGAPREGAV